MNRIIFVFLSFMVLSCVSAKTFTASYQYHMNTLDTPVTASYQATLGANKNVLREVCVWVEGEVISGRVEINHTNSEDLSKWVRVFVTGYTRTTITEERTEDNCYFITCRVELNENQVIDMLNQTIENEKLYDFFIEMQDKEKALERNQEILRMQLRNSQIEHAAAVMQYEQMVIGSQLNRLRIQGRFCKDIGKLDDAIAFYTEAYHIDPEDRSVLAELACLFLDRKDYLHALFYSQKLAEQYPENPLGPYYLGIVHESLGEEGEAIQYYEESSSKGRWTMADMKMGGIYKRFNDFSRAIDCYLVAIGKNEYCFEAYIELLNILIMNQQAESTLELADDLLNHITGLIEMARDESAEPVVIYLQKYDIDELTQKVYRIKSEAYDILGDHVMSQKYTAMANEINTAENQQ